MPGGEPNNEHNNRVCDTLMEKEVVWCDCCVGHRRDEPLNYRSEQIIEHLI